MDFTLLWLSIVVFVAGFIDSIAGGGGLLTMPAFLLAGLPPLPLLGTNKFVSTVGTLVSTGRYTLSDRMPWRIVRLGLPTMVAGALLGAHTVSHLDPQVVRAIILVALPIAAILVLLPRPRRESTDDDLRLWTIPPLTFALGWYDGFFGPGMGTLLVLALIGLTRCPVLPAAAAARFFNLTSNLGSLLIFIWRGQVLYRFALPLVLAGIAGHYCGSHLALRRGDGLVRGMLAVSSTLLVVYLLWR